MSRGVNKVIVVGNLGNDPETKYMPSGDCVCNFSVATTDSWKDKNNGEKVEETQWHRIVLYKRLAEVAGEYLRKGSQVYIEGKLKTRKWKDKEGIERYTTEIQGREMQMLGAKGGNSNAGSHNASAGNSHSNQSSHDDADTGYEDDIPF